jgi:hypothetical protein
LAALENSRLVEIKRQQLDRILQDCLGLKVESTIPRAEVVPGDIVALHHSATVQSGVPVRWLGVRYPSVTKEVNDPIDLHANQTATREVTQTIPKNATLSQPYWLREPSAVGTYHVADAKLIGRPENPPAFPIEQVFEVGGQNLIVNDAPVEIISSPSKPTIRRRLEIVAPVALNFDFEVANFVPGVAKCKFKWSRRGPAFRANCNSTFPPIGRSRRHRKRFKSRELVRAKSIHSRLRRRRMRTRRN